MRLNPKQKPPRVSSQVLPKTFVAWERGCPQLATPGVGANRSPVRSLSSPVNGQVGEEQTALDRSRIHS